MSATGTRPRRALAAQTRVDGAGVAVTLQPDV